jgi:hypothetical protein
VIFIFCLWLSAGTGAKTLYIEFGSPRENGSRESFSSKLRDEFLNGEIFYTLKEVQVLAERRRGLQQPHSHALEPPASRSGLNRNNLLKLHI